MTKLEALVITGKLEVLLQNHEQLLTELAKLQKCITEDDINGTAIYFGRLNVMINDSDIDVGENLKELYKYAIDVPTESEKEQLLNTAIENLDFSVRTCNCLKRAGILTVNDILKCDTFDKFIKIRNLDKKCFDQILENMEKLGFTDFVEKIRTEDFRKTK